jgi:bifunctional NMN adenylyltransferase/nudix hydrolase
MPYTFDYLVFIGRFQPFHLAHMQTIKIALEQSENVILALGSAQNERNTKNPFLASEREEMILSNFSEAHQKRIHFVHVIDVYNDVKWVQLVKKLVNHVVTPEAKVGLIVTWFIATTLPYSRSHLSALVYLQKVLQANYW